jgi:hypothetical protein
MLEYRERAGAEGQSAPTTAAGPGVGTGATPGYMSLHQQYGYDNDDMEFGGSSDTEQTVEQEYQAYVTAPLSAKHTNILKFWEVSNITNCASGTDRFCRSPAIRSPPFWQWPWITYPFKRLLSLANMSFPRVLKLIQSGGIISTLT